MMYRQISLRTCSQWQNGSFNSINDAEERVHGVHAHFHEVGADDAIADVIGACTALQSLGVDGVTVMPIALGQGNSNRFSRHIPDTGASDCCNSQPVRDF